MIFACNSITVGVLCSSLSWCPHIETHVTKAEFDITISLISFIRILLDRDPWQGTEGAQ